MSGNSTIYPSRESKANCALLGLWQLLESMKHSCLKGPVHACGGLKLVGGALEWHGLSPLVCLNTSLTGVWNVSLNHKTIKKKVKEERREFRRGKNKKE
uniref:Uncharacterized protein n=1 Tax=Astyanax mexicanus TaxID=7994 RepID=A0A8B9HUX7_ASTMX